MLPSQSSTMTETLSPASPSSTVAVEEMQTSLTRLRRAWQAAAEMVKRPDKYRAVGRTHRRWFLVSPACVCLFRRVPWSQ